MEVWPEVLTVVVVVAIPIVGIWLYAVAFGGRNSIDSSPPKHTQAGFIADDGTQAPSPPEADTSTKKNSADGKP